MGAAMTFTIGALAWGVPLLVASGGLQALPDRAGHAGGRGLRRRRDALPRTRAPRLAGVRPAAHVRGPLGFGCRWARWCWRWPRSGALVAAAFATGVRSLPIAGMAVPYLVFHLLFQDTAFTRYALPLVPVVAFLAVRGVAGRIAARASFRSARRCRCRGSSLGTPTLVGYGRDAGAGGARGRGDRTPKRSATHPAALAMHQTFRRPLEAERVGVPPAAAVAAAARMAGAGDVLERRATTAMVWFLADPRRTDLALIDPRSRRDVTAFRWAPSAAAGVWRHASRGRGLGADGAARWFAEEGWALTPETAGMARLMGRGPHLGPITARVAPRAGRVRRADRWPQPRRVPADPAVRFTMAVDGRTVDSGTRPPASSCARSMLPGEARWPARARSRRSPFDPPLSPGMR